MSAEKRRMSGNYQEMVLGEKGMEWGSGTETAQKGHLIPEAGRKEVKLFFGGWKVGSRGASHLMASLVLAIN